MLWEYVQKKYKLNKTNWLNYWDKKNIWTKSDLWKKNIELFFPIWHACVIGQRQHAYRYYVIKMLRPS